MSGTRRQTSAVNVLRFFNSGSLTTAIDFEVAVSRLESVLSESHVETYVERLLSTPNLFESVIASLSERCPLSRWILDAFPNNNPDAFFASQHCKLLQRLSLYFLDVSLPLERDTLNKLNAYREGVKQAEAALHTLAPGMSSPRKRKHNAQAAHRHKSRHTTMRARGSSSGQHDPDAFELLGYETPATEQEAAAIACKLLTAQKSALEYYLALLRDPELYASIRDEYSSRTVTRSAAPEIVGGLMTTQSIMMVQSTTTPSDNPRILALSDTLYTHDTDVFGEWQVLLSKRAVRDFRKVLKSDMSRLNAYVNKLVELSRGKFSTNNYKRLSGGRSGFPIYKAWVTGDIRLVYQVDCKADPATNVEHQVLIIWGMYTHQQLDHRLWDSISQQQAKRGKEYRKRRNMRRATGDRPDAFLPISWPTPAKDCADEYEIRCNVPDDIRDEVHTILVLEKFVTFSKTFLRSILADDDVQHVPLLSPQENAIVRHDSSCYILGRSGTGKTTAMIFKISACEKAKRTYSNDPCELRQLFVTKSQMLAHNVKEYFGNLMKSLSSGPTSREELDALMECSSSNNQERGTSRTLIDSDDIFRTQSTLPDRFSRLQAHDFPVFITFDRLCQLLEKDIQSLQNGDHNAHGCVVRPNPRGEANFITYDHFRASYWPHFPQHLTKGLDSSLVFSEIIGVIKGSEEALASSKRFLSRTAYEALSHRTQSTFSFCRTLIYNIFEAYIRLQKLRGDRDTADRAHDILRAFDEHGVPGQKVQTLCVDEAQDNLLIDALLLRRLCDNSQHLVWAGDTAQTISVGSSFRFGDLKAFLYRAEHSRPGITHPSTSVFEEPATFQLTVNYRSHGGIVNCAHSVIELITAFWPDSIDVLAPERGVVDGVKPIFLTGRDEDEYECEQFLFGTEEGRLEFGAEQCIIVRDFESKRELRKLLGNLGIILTVYESKGLEFDDVLLYNFFARSIANESQWRVVLNALESGSSVVRCPKFDERYHASVCHELKCLYVAITRARKNLWLYDCSPMSEPMRLFWDKRRLIQIRKSAEGLPRLAVPSTPEQWAERGDSFFHNELYSHAKRCYERAGLPAQEAIANAYDLRYQARALPSLLEDARSEAFLEAAEAYVKCGDIEVDQKRVYLANAGNCFEEGGKLDRAIQSFDNAQDFSNAARLYHKIGKIDKAAEIVRSHRNEMNFEIVNQIVVDVGYRYLADGQLDKAISLFSCIKKALEFSYSHDLEKACADLHERLGEFAVAAALHQKAGRIMEAIRVWLLDTSGQASMQYAKQSILNELWHRSFGLYSAVAAHMQTVRGLLEYAKQLSHHHLTEAEQRQLLMFEAIVHEDCGQLRRLAETFDEHALALLLCLDFIFDLLLGKLSSQIREASAPELLLIFQMFRRYAHLMRTITQGRNLTDMQRFFALRPPENNTFHVRPDTLLHKHLNRVRYLRSSDTIPISASQMALECGRYLQERLQKRGKQMDSCCRIAQVFAPSVPYFPQVNRPVFEVDRDRPTTNICLHLHLVLVLHAAHSEKEQDKDWFSLRRYWLARLCEALHPLLLGSHQFSDLPIPPADKALFHEVWSALEIWIEPQLCNADSGRISEVVTFGIQATAIMLRLNSGLWSANTVSLLQRASPLLMCLVQSLRGEERSIWKGLEFLIHVVYHNVKVNICVLCDHIEHICASLVLVGRGQIFHNVVLPRRWILKVLSTPQINELKDVRGSKLFVFIIQALIERLYAGPRTDLTLEGNDLATLPGHRAQIVSRLCRALCLLGCNQQDETLHGSILKSMQALQSLDPGSSKSGGLFRIYARARTWNDLVFAVENSVLDFPMDEIVRLDDGSGIPGLISKFPTCLFKTREPEHWLWRLQYGCFRDSTLV